MAPDLRPRAAGRPRGRAGVSSPDDAPSADAAVGAAGFGAAAVAASDCCFSTALDAALGSSRVLDLAEVMVSGVVSVLVSAAGETEEADERDAVDAWLERLTAREVLSAEG